MTTDLINLTIDGTAVSVPKGTMLIEAAKQAGVLVPHYCYHPSLPSPAVCRMCLVGIRSLPFNFLRHPIGIELDLNGNSRFN